MNVDNFESKPQGAVFSGYSLEEAIDWLSHTLNLPRTTPLGDLLVEGNYDMQLNGHEVYVVTARTVPSTVK